jgi:hypothetical protein
MSAPEVSHGRGGAGNINPDDTQYVDGEIVRQGDVGTHGDGAYSTGRGGTLSIHPSLYVAIILYNFCNGNLPLPIR